MICYPEAEHEAKCPITDIKFVNTKESGGDPDGYSNRQVYTNNFAVIFSKTATDNLPIVTTRVEVSSPCTTSSETQSPNIAYHILEKAKDSVCKASLLNNLVTDDRYKQTDFRFNLGELHDRMGVFNIMEDTMPISVD
jgi:hypothetical protein